MSGKVIVVVGGQFGSEGKGAITGHLAASEPNPVSVVRVAGPNAGHTVVDSEFGQKRALRHLPVGAYVRDDARLYLAAGSEIDYSVLQTEMGDWRAWHHARGWEGSPSGVLMVDPQATVLMHEHVAMESDGELTQRLGSTGKGIGAARAERVMRRADTVGAYRPALPGVAVRDVTSNLRNDLAEGRTVIIEGTQGFGLGLHAGYYPKCTSSDCRAIDFLAMTGLSPWEGVIDALEVWVVFRTYPIRVAGASGPMHGETSWEELGLEPELTTVTRKVRRVGVWDSELARRAMTANGAPSYLGAEVYTALTMFDQVEPRIAGHTSQSEPIQWNQTASDLYMEVCRSTGQAPNLIGTGPDSVIDLRVGGVDRRAGVQGE